MQVKVFAFWHKHTWQKAFELLVTGVDMSTVSGWHKAGEFELELDIKPLDRGEQTRLQVDELRKQQADLQVQQNLLTQQINDLLCLEHVS